MKAVGVVVEYNPFHNGHAFHLEQAMKVSGADISIAVMSGNFLQRGEPALVSKWIRTQMALSAGVDLIFELPYKFATQHAEVFADGAISILSAAGCEAVCFGSESGNSEAFTRTIRFLEENNTTFQKNIKNFMSKGFSYPKSLSLSFQSISPSDDFIDISSPNNILGLHYMQSILKQGSSMLPLTIQRKAAGYHDEQFASETIASATSIRNALLGTKGELSSIQNLVPKSTYELLLHYHSKYGGFHSWEDYWPYLKFKLLHSSKSEIKSIYEVEEGLENRLKDAATTSSSFFDFMNKIKTKRYTWTRLQRVCLHILTNTKKEAMKEKNHKASYLRLLGATEKGRTYLNLKKKKVELPIVSKISSYSHPDLDIEINASSIYALGRSGNGQELLLAEEFSHPPVFSRSTASL